MNRSRGITLRETKAEGKQCKEGDRGARGFVSRYFRTSQRAFEGEISEAAAFSRKRDTCGFD